MKKLFVAALISSVVSAPALAADTGAYGALDVQSYSATNTAPLGNPGMGFSIGGGYHFNKNVAAEADYAMTGSSNSVGGMSYKATSLQLAAVGTYPINDQFDVFGKLGMAANKVTVTGANCQNCSKTDLMYGVGAQYNINQQIGVRLQYLSLGKATNQGTQDVAITSTSIGAVYNF